MTSHGFWMNISGWSAPFGFTHPGMHTIFSSSHVSSDFNCQTSANWRSKCCRNDYLKTTPNYPHFSLWSFPFRAAWLCSVGVLFSRNKTCEGINPIVSLVRFVILEVASSLFSRKSGRVKQNQIHQVIHETPEPLTLSIFVSRFFSVWCLLQSWVELFINIQREETQLTSKKNLEQTSILFHTISFRHGCCITKAWWFKWHFPLEFTSPNHISLMVSTSCQPTWVSYLTSDVILSY